MKKILYVINPISGKGRYDYVEQSIKFHSNTKQLDYEIWKWNPVEALDEYLPEVVATRKFDIVVAVGGDGTVHHVAKHLVNTNTVLGILPVGSGDGIARHFKISHNLGESIGNLKYGKIISIDTGLVNDRFFMGFLGAGLDAVVAHLFAKRKKRGFLRYAQLTLWHYFKINKQKCVVEIDGKIRKEFPYLLSVANTSQYGNGALIAPRASATDGKLDVVLINKKNLFLFPDIFFRLFNGLLPSARYYKWYKGENIKITFDTEEQKIQLDGEPAFAGKELNIRVVPNSLKLIVPPKAVLV